MGPIGSGKSTQAKLLAKELNLTFVSSGDTSREIVEEDSEDGRAAKAKLNAGELIPDEILFPRLRKKLLAAIAGHGFIIDGYPRNIEQLVPFDILLKELEEHIDKIIFINLSDEEIVRRIQGPATKENRTDDVPEVIKERLKIYREQTIPIVDYYRRQGKLIEVDGSRTIEEVHFQIQNNLNNNGKKRT